MIMTVKILGQNKTGTFCATVSRTMIIDSPVSEIWGIVGDYTGLANWVEGIQKTVSLSKVKNDFGAARKIHFKDGAQVIEYAVGWKENDHISYIATSGLPLQGYHATISLTTRTKGTQVKWSSFLISESSDKIEFLQFLESMDMFYAKSLVTLKQKLEKQNKLPP